MLRTALPVLLLTLAAIAGTARPARAQNAPPPGGCNVKWDIKSQDALNINATHYRLIKDVAIDCNEVQLFADEVEVFSDIDRMRASGNVVFVSATNRIAAERMEFNTRTKTGTFYVASGIANLENRGVDRSLFGTQEPDAYFWGETIEKLGPKTYRISRGGFTTCVQPTPRWEMVATTVTLTLEKRAVLTNMVLKVKDVPVFYLPGMYYPINKSDRATGFLIPIYGSSSIKGQTINNAFFWAINRSQDATLYHSFYSKTGQGFGGEYRYIESAGSAGNIQTSVLKEHAATYQNANGTTTTIDPLQSYSITGSVQQQLPAQLRLSGAANYFSSLIAQQRYQQNVFAATNRTRNFGANLSGNWGANSVSGTVERNELFTNDTDSNLTGSFPRVHYSRAEERFGKLPIYFGTSSEFVTLIRSVKAGDTTTDSGLTRLDLYPTIRFPFTKLSFLTFNSSLGFRETYWTASLDKTGTRVPDSIQRRYVRLGTTITGPVFTKIFNTPHSSYAQKYKHVIEPTLSINRVSTIANSKNIVLLEGTDYDIGNTAVTYGLSNRFYAKKESSREILMVALTQTYNNNQDAAARDRLYQSSEFTDVLRPSHLSPLALQVHASPTTATDASFRAEYDTQVHAVRSYSANGGAGGGWVRVNAGWSLNRLIPTKIGGPVTTSAHYLNAGTLLRKPGNAFAATYDFNFDMKNKDFLNQRLIAHYNTQCCGVAVEYQKFNFGTRAGLAGVPQDHRFNLSFTLAGIGTFSDLFGAFGGQQGR